MKKTTPQKLSNRLAKYGALSLAIAGIADANGQIVYTDIIPDFDQDDEIYIIELKDNTSIAVMIKKIVL